MGFCKSLLVVITLILMCSGLFGHRFQRHLNAVSLNAAAIENIELKNFNLDNEMASDESIGVPDENNNTNIKLIKPGEIELELLHGELQFQICTKDCMGTEVVVCFESTNSEQFPNSSCGSNQCEFLAGVQKTKSGIRQIWFMEDTTSMGFIKDTCENAIMQSPYARAPESFQWPLASCYPTKHDANVVKLYVKTATRNCPLYVIGAKLWYHPTPPPPTAASELPTKPTPSKPPPSSSTADSSNTLWIIIGVVSGVLVIALLIGLGCLIYHRCIKKKSTAAAAVAKVDGKKIQISTETKTITEVQTPIVKQETEKAVEEKEDEKKSGVEKVTKEETKVPKPKKKASKQKSKKQKKKEGKEKKKVAPPPTRKAPTPNRTKPTQEETPPNAAEPAFIDTTATSLAAPKPAAPNLCVLDKIIVPQRSHESSNQSNSESRKSGSISGHQDLNMQMIVENPSQAVARFYDNSDPYHSSSTDKKVSEAKMQEIKDFYPIGKKAREFKHEEISILCCYRISTMFDKIETMRTTAKKKLQDHGAVFDHNGCITNMPPGTLYYVQNRATAEYIRAFSFGALFYQEIDRHTASQVVMSIPLLFSLILQPRYPVLQRRKACVWIRRQLPIIFKKYSLVELRRLAYPICAMKEACYENRSGFYNSVLHTETKDEIEPPPSSYRPKGKLIEYNPKMDKNVIF